MKTVAKGEQKQASNDEASVADLLDIIAQQQSLLAAANKQIDTQQCALKKASDHGLQQQRYIRILEEQLRLATLRKFAASSEKIPCQFELFDEAELEVSLDDLEKELPEETQSPLKKTKRNREFSGNLKRIRIEHTLSDEERAQADKTFFTKVKEELEFIPAQLLVKEHWQEKAVLIGTDGEEQIIAAKRPVHPLGKCFASPALLAYIMVSKYADGLPLYRLENQFQRLGNEISRSNMANWMIRLNEPLKPLMTLIRETQNSGSYLQADETRIQVLKEDGKSAQSKKWMWVTCGGPPNNPSVLFEYDPTRSGAVPERLLDGFSGTLQADGYSGYGKICQQSDVRRIGCWDHARRKFVEAVKAADTKSKSKGPSKADVAVAKIRKLYAIEKELKDQPAELKYQARQEKSVPLLNGFKTWLEKNVTRVMKGSLTRIAMEYTLNQWEYLIGYCEDGNLNISNAKAENAIRPFAVGRRAWLFADTPQGARASATCYSLIETAKANHIEPYAYISHVLNHIADADTLEKIEALLPWNMKQLPRLLARN